MSAVASPMTDADWGRVQRNAIIAALAGLGGYVLVGLGLYLLHGLTAPMQFFLSYLVAFVYWFGVGLGCLVILMLQYMTGGAWGVVMRRILEAGSRTVLPLLILCVPLFFGLRSTYLWANPDLVAHDEDLLHKSAYLNVPFVIGRTVAFFLLWSVFAYFLNRWSSAQDSGQPGLVRYGGTLSGPGVVVYGITITFASIDWVMSLDPFWVSTIFPVLFAVGQLLTGFAFAILVLVLLSDRPPLDAFVTPRLLQGVAGLLLTFVMFWAYMQLSQLLLIWAENLPEEVPWYLRRARGGWEWVAAVLFVLHFLVPFLLLLFKDVKRNRGRLLAVAVCLLVMRFVDVFWWIEPAVSHEGQHAYWLLDLAATVFVGGIWVWLFTGALRQRPLLPLHDPYLPGRETHAVA